MQTVVVVIIYFPSLYFIEMQNEVYGKNKLPDLPQQSAQIIPQIYI